jgi:hypothetical protein
MPELIWEGKYDDAGRRMALPRIALPFQTVETINESAQQRQESLDFFATDRTIRCKLRPSSSESRRTLTRWLIPHSLNHPPGLMVDPNRPNDQRQGTRSS